MYPVCNDFILAFFSCHVSRHDAMSSQLDKVQTILSLVKDDLKVKLDAASSSPCKVRDCYSHFFRVDANILTSLPNIANRRIRNGLCSDITDPDHKQKMTKIYTLIGMCEAPKMFSTKLYANEGNGRFYQVLVSYLHVLYGDIIVPTRYGLMEDTDKRMIFEDQYDLIDTLVAKMPYIDKHESVHIHQLVKNFKSLPVKVQLVYVTVSISKGGPSHAMIIAFWIMPRDRNVHLGIICPSTTALTEHYQVLLRYVNHHKGHKNHGYVVHTDIPPNIQGAFQETERHYTRTVLDPNGHCGAWVLFMMEVIANRVLSGIPFNSYPFELLDIIDLPCIGQLTSTRKPVSRLWRKLIMDYMFTRLMDMLAIARVMKNNSVDVHMKNILGKYITTVRKELVVTKLDGYLPDFNNTAIRMAKYSF